MRSKFFPFSSLPLSIFVVSSFHFCCFLCPFSFHCPTFHFPSSFHFFPSSFLPSSFYFLYFLFPSFLPLLSIYVSPSFLIILSFPYHLSFSSLLRIPFLPSSRSLPYSGDNESGIYSPILSPPFSPSSPVYSLGYSPSTAPPLRHPHPLLNIDQTHPSHTPVDPPTAPLRQQPQITALMPGAVASLPPTDEPRPSASSTEQPKMDIGYQCPVCSVIYRSYDQVLSHIRGHMEAAPSACAAPPPLPESLTGVAVDAEGMAVRLHDNNAGVVYVNNNHLTAAQLEYPVVVSHVETSPSAPMSAAVAGSAGVKAEKKTGKQRGGNKQQKSSRSLSPSAALDMEMDDAQGRGKVVEKVSLLKNRFFYSLFCSFVFIFVFFSFFCLCLSLSFFLPFSLFPSLSFTFFSFFSYALLFHSFRCW